LHDFHPDAERVVAAVGSDTAPDAFDLVGDFLGGAGFSAFQQGAGK
jgi:hypothetical protein